MLDKETITGQQISRRVFIIGAGKLGLLCILASRMFYMQFIKKDEYKTLSDNNRIRIIAILPKRGQIIDINEIPITKNRSCFQLLLEKSVNPKYKDEISYISYFLELDEDQIKDLQHKASKAGYKVPAVIIDFLEWNQVSIIEERKSELKSLFVDSGYNRFYPMKESCAHLLGYLGKSNNKDDKNYLESFKVGRNGIEKQYDDVLRGNFGHKQIEVNARGKFIREIKSVHSKAGQNIKLNIDSKLQAEAMKLLNPQGSSISIMNIHTGAIICLCSSPSFDPNMFNKLSQKYWNSLTSNPYNPLINKVTQSQYPPGSLFKLVTILAALEDGHNPNEKIYCNGGPFLGGNSFRCSRLSGHGSIALDEAIKTSCNVYIYNIASRIGADKIISMAKRLGLDDKTGIDLPNEKSGFMPTREWKKDKIGNVWTKGDTLNLSIGQGFSLTTPLLLTRLIATIASNGKICTPQILNSEEHKHYDANIDSSLFEYIKCAMYRVMNEPGGTAYYSRINVNDHKMAGKTGTAQVLAKKDATDNLSRADIAWYRRNHAIFGGFAPYVDPQYALCVYYDHGGGGGSAAAPIGSHIMKMILEGIA